MQPFGHNTDEPKIGDCAPMGRWVPIYHIVAWAEAYLHTKWHLNPSTVWPQDTNVTDRQKRQDRQPFYKRSPQNECPQTFSAYMRDSVS